MQDDKAAATAEGAIEEHQQLHNTTNTTTTKNSNNGNNNSKRLEQSASDLGYAALVRQLGWLDRGHGGLEQCCLPDGILVSFFLLFFSVKIHCRSRCETAGGWLRAHCTEMIM